jgi:hypothetical protein
MGILTLLVKIGCLKSPKVRPYLIAPDGRPVFLRSPQSQRLSDTQRLRRRMFGRPSPKHADNLR